MSLQNTAIDRKLDEASVQSDMKLWPPTMIEKLAGDLADCYVEYFTIDFSHQKQKAEDSIEECLTHLEEVSSLLDNYKQNSSDITTIFEEKLAGKGESLNKLYEQVDAIEQYIFEVNKLLDCLENNMKELELHKKFNGNKIIDIISRFSLNNLPSFGLLGTTSASSESTTSISELLSRISDIENSLSTVTSNLNVRLQKQVAEKNTRHKESMLGCDLPEQVDGSWLEL